MRLQELPGKQRWNNPGHPRGHGFGAQLCPAEPLPRVSPQHLPRTPRCFPRDPGTRLQEVGQRSSTTLSFQAGNRWRRGVVRGETTATAISVLKQNPPQKPRYQRFDGSLAFTPQVYPMMCTRSGHIMHARQRGHEVCNHLQSPCTLGSEPARKSGFQGAIPKITGRTWGGGGKATASPPLPRHPPRAVSHLP